MKILVIGAGGREHAIAWKLAQSARVAKVFVAPGNAGTALEEGVENIALDPMDFAAQLKFIEANAIALTVVGPEAPLVAGIVDRFQERGLPCFGPSAAAAQLEGSKAFTKDFLKRHAIPTAGYETFVEVEPALAYLQRRGVPVVIKADGLAAGKGVVVAQTLAEAESAVRDMLGAKRFGAAGARIVIEEFLQGEEASFIVMCDGVSVVPLATSQDHKARDDGDLGPNTGGMGAYSPAPVITAELEQRVMREVIEPTLAGLSADGISYSGFLYAGLMIGSDGVPRVLEFNCRFGDPETQPILARLNTDLVALCKAATEGRLADVPVAWDPRAALGVVIAAGGYPEAYKKGLKIDGLPDVEDGASKVFHAGTALAGDAVVTAGGRVLCVVGLGASVREAREFAYAQVRQIHFDGAFHRSDIGYRALAREVL